jgi:iron complex transport system permease protein
MMLILAVVLAGLIVVRLFIGQNAGGDDELQWLFWELRSLRSLAAAVVGAALAVSGVLLQGLFRNPLADPSIIGTSAGATLGGMIMVLLGQLTAAYIVLPPLLLLPLGCILGGLLSLWCILLVARRCQDTTSVLLAGVVLSMLFASIGAGIGAWAQGYLELSRALQLFALGGIDGKGIEQVLIVLPLFLAAFIAAWWWWAPSLDVLLSGEDEAMSLGVNLSRLRRWIIIWATFAVASAVAIGGSVAFVGLIVPHLLRGCIGPRHRRLLPAAALGGMIFVCACDSLIHLLPTPSPMPLGVVTGLIGAPLFVLLLLRLRQRGQV